MLRIWTGTQALLMEALRGIPQFGQANIFIVPYIRHDRFLAVHFQSITPKLGNSSEPWCLRY
jgi:hypothetical protein